MPLLSEVYSGRIDHQQTKLNEYGGQKMEAQVIPGGIKIAAIEQRDLEYDPQLYQRDRGELDWDSRSVMSMGVLMGDNESVRSKTPSQLFTNDMAAQRNLSGYERYLTSGPGRNDIELAPMASTTDLNQPLLNQYYEPPRQFAPPMNPRYSYSSSSPPSVPPSTYYGVDGNREAPIHRPHLSGQQMSSYDMSGHDRRSSNQGSNSSWGGYRNQ